MTAAVKKKQGVNLATRIADCSFDPGSRNYDVFHVNESSYLLPGLDFCGLEHLLLSGYTRTAGPAEWS